MKESLMNWTFNCYMPTEVIFGCGKIQEVGKLAKRFGNKALLVTNSANSPRGELYRRVMDILKEEGIESWNFDGVVANPTTDSISAGAKIAKENGVEMVIGLGGGSAMDTAKAIAVEATHDGSAWDHLYYKDPPTEKTLPIIAIGTTAGTGSQTTSVAVLTNPETKDKSAISNRNVFPKIAIVDPELTYSMPKNITAQTGFDAFCHNFESLLSIKAGPMNEALCIDAIKRVFKYLLRVVKDGTDEEARIEMSWVDTLGGYTNAFAGTTLPHGLGMQIGGHCPWVTHGQALAAIYPSFTRYTRETSKAIYAKLARELDSKLNEVSDEEASLKLCEMIDDLLKSIDLYIGLKDVNVTMDDIRAIADCGQVLGDYKRNPRVASIEEMYDMLVESYERC